MKPLVSIIMPVYNVEKYIRDAVDSILCQSYNHFEFIIINDASTDNTLKILQSYNDPRIKLISNRKNLRVAKSLNLGINESKGKYIARMDGDDISHPERIKKQVEFLEKFPDIILCGSFYSIIDIAGRIKGKVTLPITPLKIKIALVAKNCIAHGSVLIRRSVFDDVGLYNEEYTHSQDYELWTRIVSKYNISNIPEYLYSWRVNETNMDEKKIRLQIDSGNRIVSRNYRNLKMFPYLILGTLYKMLRTIRNYYSTHKHN